MAVTQLLFTVPANVRTRRQLHGVTEMLIAGPQHRRHSTIRLSVARTGFGGTLLQIGVEGTHLVRWPQGRAKFAGPRAAPVLWPEHFDVGVTINGAEHGVDRRCVPAAAMRLRGRAHRGKRSVREYRSARCDHSNPVTTSPTSPISSAKARSTST